MQGFVFKLIAPRPTFVSDMSPEERTTMLELDLFKGSAYHAQPLKILGHDAAISAAAKSSATTIPMPYDPAGSATGPNASTLPSCASAVQ